MYVYVYEIYRYHHIHEYDVYYSIVYGSKKLEKIQSMDRLNQLWWCILIMHDVNLCLLTCKAGKDILWEKNHVLLLQSETYFYFGKKCSLVFQKTIMTTQSQLDLEKLN